MTRPLYIAVALVTLLALSGCSAARKNYNEGKELEEQGKLEEAMYRYAEAVKHAPDESEYRVKFLNTRMAAAKGREQEGDGLVKAGNYAGAVTSYQTAAGLDGSQPRLVQKATNAIRLRDAAAAYQEGLSLEKGNKLREAATAYGRALDLAAENKEYTAAALRIAGLRKSRLDGFELQLKSKQPITLRFRETRLKDIYSVISQLSGINFIFDPDVKDQSVTITLENATFQQATDLLTGMYKLGHKILNETTVLIYPHSAEKTKQYQDMQLRTFHLNHLDAKKAANLIRTLLQVRRLHINEDANALVVRDTREVNEVIEKILEANDLPEAEVVLDVEVIEISDKNAKNVGLLLSNYDVQLGAFSPFNKLLATSLKDATTVTTNADGSKTEPKDASIENLVRAFAIKGFGGYITVPNAQYNFGKTLANGEVLSNPKIRVKNKEKAKFNVGTRVPITTTTMATTGTTSQVNVQYVDVGVKVNAEPTIQLNNEVSIKLGLEVSSIISRETVGGKDSATTVVTIGTRNLDTVLSLKDGETSVIGGLIANSKSDSQQKIFLLGDIPLLGPLLSNNKTDNDKTELILAITPRLVRGVTVLPRKVTSFISGKEDDPSVKPPYASFEQEPEYAAPAPPPAVKPPAVPAVKPHPPQAMPAQPSNRLAPLPLPQTKAAPVPQQQLAPPAAPATAAPKKAAVPNQAPQPPRKPHNTFKMAPLIPPQQKTPVPPRPVTPPVMPPPVAVTPDPVPVPLPAEPEPPPPVVEQDPASEAAPPPDIAVTTDP